MRILHVFRSPVGGLFRHVRDLARGQKELGHHVGIFCDSDTGGEGAAAALATTLPHCAGGIATHPIARLPSWSDFAAIAACRKMAASGQFDIIHCHGAKGGTIGRLVGRKLGIPAIYCPHGGSLHYSWLNPLGAGFLLAEKLLSHIGAGFVFVSQFEKAAFEAKIGTAGKPATVVYNGLWPEEFLPIVHRADATDLVFVGEVRHLKGIDLLFEAMRILKPTLPLTLTVFGDGPELQHHVDLAARLGLARDVVFAGRAPIAEAMARGRLMVVPSRKESFPYVVLEAAAAAQPIIASRVGGIPEILPAEMLSAPQAAAIAASIATVQSDMALARGKATELAAVIRKRFAANRMVGEITDFYSTFLLTVF